MRQLNLPTLDLNTPHLETWINNYRRAQLMRVMYESVQQTQVLLQARIGSKWINLTVGHGATSQEAFTAALQSLVENLGLAHE